MTPQQIELADRCQQSAKQMQAEQAELERLQAEYKQAVKEQTATIAKGSK